MSHDHSVRDRAFEFVQSIHADDDDLDGAVLVGFLIVAEWQAPNGKKWLSKVSGDHDRHLPVWRERMLGFEVAHHWAHHWWDDEREE